MNLKWNKTRLKSATSKPINQTLENENARNPTDTLEQNFQNLSKVLVFVEILQKAAKMTRWR